MLRGMFPEGKFSLEKPAFDIETESGPCLPDLFIRARLGEDELTFDVEVMAFGRRGYLRRSEVTQPRTETLGTLCVMHANGPDPKSGSTARGKKRDEDDRAGVSQKVERLTEVRAEGPYLRLERPGERRLATPFCSALELHPIGNCLSSCEGVNQEGRQTPGVAENRGAAHTRLWPEPPFPGFDRADTAASTNERMQ